MLATVNDFLRFLCIVVLVAILIFAGIQFTKPRP